MSKSDEMGPLQDMGRVVIIGGGPAGTACALALDCLAKKMGRKIEITLIEAKQFAGEQHYNQCTGVLSPPLPSLLEEQLGVSFPYQLCQREICGYVLHTSRTQILLEEECEPSLAVRRVQFDAYMLDMVRQRGICILPARAVDLEFYPDRVVVYTDSMPEEADVVVGAFGMDEGSITLFSRLTSYRPPQALFSVVKKYHPGEPGMQAFGPHVHAFVPSHPHIEFAAITPKGNHLTINIAGLFVNIELMQDFLEREEVRALLPGRDLVHPENPKDVHFFKGRFPSSLARNYYGDRYVMVGDSAGLMRASKGKGVTSAVLTGIRAAETMLHVGISEKAFHESYRAANYDITDDMPYGRFMRMATIFMARYQLLDPVIRAAKAEPGLRYALFQAVSGYAPYQEVISKALHPRSIIGILREMLP